MGLITSDYCQSLTGILVFILRSSMCLRVLNPVYL